MNVLKKIKPVLVLSIICTLICALLIVTYNLTYVDTSGVLTDNLKAGCIAADGEGEYALITDKAAAKLDGEEFGNISKIVKNKTKGTFLFETVVDGYAADGIDAVIAIDKNGAVSGISIIALGETPGLRREVGYFDSQVRAEKRKRGTGNYRLDAFLKRYGEGCKSCRKGILGNG